MDSRIVYVNGEFLKEKNAKLSVFDRGFLFADAVYEVTAVLDSKLVDWNGHVKRLKRSLAELKMYMPKNEQDLLNIHREIISKNDLTEGVVYLQISRGIADRSFEFPDNAKQSIVVFSQKQKLRNPNYESIGISIISTPDIRWARRDVKTVQLLGSSLCKMMAKNAGKDDSWMVEDGKCIH